MGARPARPREGSGAAATPRGASGAALLALVLAACAGAPVAAPAPERDEPVAFRGSPAAAALAATGRVVAGEAIVDLDGDGVPEALVVEGVLGPEGPDPQEAAVSLWRRGADGNWERTHRSPAFPANRVAAIEVARPGCGGGALAAVELREDRPDEVARTVLVLGGLPDAPRVLHRETVVGPDRAEDRLAASFLGRPLGIHLEPGPTLAIDEEPKVLALTGPDGGVAEVAVGHARRVLRCDEGRLVPAGRTWIDRLVPTGLAAGRAGDGDLATGLPAGEVVLAAGGPVRALRVVGCAGGAPGPLGVEGLAGGPLALDPSAAVPARDPRVLGAGRLPVPGAPGAEALLVVFRMPLETGERLLLNTQGAAGGCVAELSVYGQL